MICCPSRSAFLAGLLALAALVLSCESSNKSALDPNGELAQPFSSLQARAQNGDAGAQYRLGYLKEQGQACAANLKEAAHWYRFAAEQGHPAAQYRLGMLYFEARGVALDFVEAERLLLGAASQSYAPAQDKLDILRLLTAQNAKDQKRAYRLLQAAARGGNRTAQQTLGRLYAKGLGLAVDPEQAAFWHGRAAAQQSLPKSLRNSGSAPAVIAGPGR
ncbi:MAG: hypothetical protein CSA62_04615 [Planctomycetota bacterium]|nr:MAG: hypothetical protein CSA62_04615 [Planctomycetota bacterium]